MGFRLSEAELNRIFEDFKVLADRKKEIYDADLEALVERRGVGGSAVWKLVSLDVATGTATLPHAAVCLEYQDGTRSQEAACGNGPLDALFKAIGRITGMDGRLTDFQVRSVTVGEDAQGEVTVEIECDGRRYRGRAVHTDVIHASAEAFVQVVNRVTSRPQPVSELVAVRK